MIRRRTALLGAVALAAATLSAAPSALAANKVIDAGKVFPFLEAYRNLPAAERTKFKLVYYLHVGPQPITAPVWLVDGAQRTLVPLRADGRVERLPTSAELAHAKLEIGMDAAVKMGVNMGVEPMTPPATELDAAELAQSIAQAAVGAKKSAGIMALAMPKLQDVAFVGASSGEVIFADGRRAALPLVKGVPTYNPTTLPGAKTLRFARPPQKLDIN